MSVKLLESELNMKEKEGITVDGYIREIEQTLFGDNDDRFIPSVINQLCIEYHRIIRDSFDPLLRGDKLCITHDTVTRIDRARATAFLSNILNELIIGNLK